MNEKEIWLKREKEQENKIRQLVKQNEIKLKNEKELKNKCAELRNELNSQKIDLSSQDIQKMMDDNINMKNKIQMLNNNRDKQINVMNNQIKYFKTKINNMNNQIYQLIKDNNEYKKNCETLLLRINELEQCCGQYQLMIQNKNQNINNNNIVKIKLRIELKINYFINLKNINYLFIII